MQVYRDKNSGAVIFRYSPEELRQYELEKRVQELEQRVKQLEEIVLRGGRCNQCHATDTEE